jgi:Domain of unknown function (DUF4169)
MAELINLRLARKRADRKEAEKTSAERRVAFGRTKQERELARATAEKRERALDGHRKSGGTE